MRKPIYVLTFALMAVGMVVAQSTPGTSSQSTVPPAQTSPAPTNSSANPPGSATGENSQVNGAQTTQPAANQTQTTDQNANPNANIPGTAPAAGGQNTTPAPSGGFGQRTAPASGGTDQVPSGTEMHATLDTPLSTKTSKPGDRFTATLTQAVNGSNGLDVLPSGARVEGEVADAEEGKAVAALRGKGKLSLRFRDVVLPNGQTLPLTATLVSVNSTNGKDTKAADQEGQVESGTRGKDVAKNVGIGAGIGTVAGLIFGGPLKGLAIGALAGGGYVLATKGKDVNLPAQTGMVIRLDQPISANVSSPLQR